MILLLEALIAMGVVMTVAFVAIGRIDGLEPAERDLPDHTLPERRLVADDVDQARFSLALRGYRMDEVDDALDRLADELTLRDREIDELRARLGLPPVSRPLPARAASAPETDGTATGTDTEVDEEEYDDSLDGAAAALGGPEPGVAGPGSAGGTAGPGTAGLGAGEAGAAEPGHPVVFEDVSDDAQRHVPSPKLDAAPRSAAVWEPEAARESGRATDPELAPEPDEAVQDTGPAAELLGAEPPVVDPRLVEQVVEPRVDEPRVEPRAVEPRVEPRAVEPRVAPRVVEPLTTRIPAPLEVPTTPPPPIEKPLIPRVDAESLLRADWSFQRPAEEGPTGESRADEEHADGAAKAQDEATKDAPHDPLDPSWRPG